jgi:carbon storage regulator CsrA
MLVLSRRLNEKIKFPAIDTTVQVVRIRAGTVRLGIEAPPEVVVLREELPDREVEWGAAENPAGTAEARLRRVLGNRLQIAHAGLALLRDQLRAGLVEEAAVTIDNLDEDLQLLRERLGAEDRQPLPPPPAPRKARALLVEDNANERELLATFLRLSGLDVITAGDGADALDCLRCHGLPDMVLLDMGLPRCDGPTVVRNIRRDPSWAGVKIFAVSGHVPEEFDLASGPTGVNRWFHKPINPGELVRSLNQELESSCRRV